MDKKEKMKLHKRLKTEVLNKIEEIDQRRQRKGNKSRY